MNQSVEKRVAQGLKDAREWQRFLKEQGKSHRVLVDADEFAVVDVLQISDEGKFSHVELKERTHPFGTYPDCLVDESKIRQLQRLHAETNELVMVAALYPLSNRIAIWRIKEDDEFEVRKVLANATSVQTGESVKVYKDMCVLPLKNASKHTHQFTLCN